MRKLPPELVERRLKELEDNFNRTLSSLADRILNDCPKDKRNEHQSKTYFLVSAIYKEVCRRKVWAKVLECEIVKIRGLPAAANIEKDEELKALTKLLRPIANLEFFVLGEERSIEKARAHMFSNSATGLFELGFVGGAKGEGEGETEEKRAAGALMQNAAGKP